jgi:hypothetical protein
MPVEIALGVACMLSDFGYTCAYKTVFLKKRTGGLQKLFPGLSGLFLLFMGHLLYSRTFSDQGSLFSKTFVRCQRSNQKNRPVLPGVRQLSRELFYRRGQESMLNRYAVVHTGAPDGF